MLAAQSPEHVKPGDPPEWVAEWLEKRRAREEKVAAPAALKPVPDPKAKQRRWDERQKGPARLGTARSLAQGLGPRGCARPGCQAGVGMGRASQTIGRRPGAGTCRPAGARLAFLPRSSPDAVPRLLGELGRIKLLLHAYGRIDQIEPPLASEIRQMLGWNVTQEVLEREGRQVADRWIVAGQWDDDGDRFITRRSWLIGRRTGRMALMLQFGAAAPAVR